MQRSLAAAALAGAIIIAAALVYHGRQLAQLSNRLERVEERSGALDQRLESFSAQLPGVIEQAGRNAGRQAVHGMVDEVVQVPLRWLRGVATGDTNQAHIGTNTPKAEADWTIPGGFGLDRSAPWVRFDIREPVVTIEILPNLRSLSGSSNATAEASPPESPASAP